MSEPNSTESDLSSDDEDAEAEAEARPFAGDPTDRSPLASAGTTDVPTTSSPTSTPAGSGSSSESDDPFVTARVGSTDSSGAVASVETATEPRRSTTHAGHSSTPSPAISEERSPTSSPGSSAESDSSSEDDHRGPFVLAPAEGSSGTDVGTSGAATAERAPSPTPMETSSRSASSSGDRPFGQPLVGDAAAVLAGSTPEDVSDNSSTSPVDTGQTSTSPAGGSTSTAASGSSSREVPFSATSEEAPPGAGHVTPEELNHSGSESVPPASPGPMDPGASDLPSGEGESAPPDRPFGNRHFEAAPIARSADGSRTTPSGSTEAPPAPRPPPSDIDPSASGSSSEVDLENPPFGYSSAAELPSTFDPSASRDGPTSPTAVRGSRGTSTNLGDGTTEQTSESGSPSSEAREEVPFFSQGRPSERTTRSPSVQAPSQVGTTASPSEPAPIPSRAAASSSRSLTPKPPTPLERVGAPSSSCEEAPSSTTVAPASTAVPVLSSPPSEGFAVWGTRRHGRTRIEGGIRLSSMAEGSYRSPSWLVPVREIEQAPPQAAYGSFVLAYGEDQIYVYDGIQWVRVESNGQRVYAGRGGDFEVFRDRLCSDYRDREPNRPDESTGARLVLSLDS